MTTPAGPRWQKWKKLHNKGALQAGRGNLAAANRLVRKAYELTLTAPDDPEALARRAQTLINLAGLAEGQEAIDLVNTAIELTHECEALVGDEFGTVSLRATLFAVRAMTVLNTGEWQEPLADLRRSLDLEPANDTAQPVLGNLLTWLVQLAHALRHHADFTQARQVLDAGLDAITWFPLPQEQGQAAFLSTRASVLAAAGDYAEAAADAEQALTLAERSAPTLIPNVHQALADIADGTGDQVTAVEHLHLARELFAAIGEGDGEAVALNSLGRLAHLAGRDEEALTHYTAAARLGTDPWHRVVSQFGRAAIAVTQSRPRETLRLLADVPVDSPRILSGVLSVRGNAYESLAEFAKADECLDQARALCVDNGMWHMALTLDSWRSGALHRRAAHGVPPAELVAPALDLALPAALAAEAARRRFRAGPMRERWIAQAAAPATKAALVAIGATLDEQLIVAYLDHLAAAVSLPGQSAEPAEIDHSALLSLPTPQDLALVAAGEGEPLPVPELLLPPRVRANTAVPSPLDPWLDLAEQRYGIQVRSAEVVRSW
ncbi:MULTISPECIES: tetratricopeptide repeat protein [unclassified Crossiella]|uniref:tetratricopeptide repeat protein n=1 Tax=unclassified Crossiella TaxID=2620835 RepID=UPI001FFF453D|nr:MULTISPECIES: tetratricopeptide repeat protein [unclassified Crossiella]MCK2244717.1 tetratricopeptide repeat protein [Crossiella sp. S99.2]MCK2258285.1 tetratricopeptide repeat protein [Crossiella sp. S99.1]